MDWSWYSLSWLSFCVLAAFLLLRWTRATKHSSKNLPPGPPGWPIVGNIFDLGTIPHQQLYKFQAKYGPVVWLKLGSVNTMVVQSAKAAEELFKNHDLHFSDRKVTEALTAFGYDQGALAVSSYCPYWRVLRRIYSMELLVNRRINESAPLRQKCIDNMIKWIDEDAEAARAKRGTCEVQLVHFLFLMAFNLVGNMVFSRDFVNNKSEEVLEFLDAMNKLMMWAAKPNVADFFPFLKWLDPQGIKRNMVRDMGRCLEITTRFVKQRVHEKQIGKQEVKKDFLDVLLEYEGDGKEGPNKLSEANLNIIILEMFFGGSATTSSSIEWAMAELLRNPDSMKKAKEELDRVVGLNRKVQESDIDKLPYLHAVVKETLRLHPPVPLLVPRNAVEDTNFMGYLIPKNTQVFVNAWGIGRDPEAWEDPFSFKPDRFLGSNIEYNGQHFEFIPFGSGRRICVGLALAHRVVNLTLAALLQCFDWEVDSCISPESLDMDETMGIAMRKLVPLKAIPKRRSV